VGQAGDPLDNISVGRLPNRRLQVREHSLALTRLTLKVTSRPRAPSRRWTAQLLCQSEPEPILSARRFVTSQSASVVRDTARADVAKAVSLSVGPQRSNPQMKALILRRLRSQPSSDRRAPKAASHRTIRRATGDKDPQRSPSPRWCIDRRAQDSAVRQPRARYQSRERAQHGRHNSHSTPSLGDVAIGVRGFFHAYIRRGECSGYEDGDEVTIEAQGRWYGIEMMCASDPIVEHASKCRRGPIGAGHVAQAPLRRGFFSGSPGDANFCNRSLP
jgi:hypothetical protein